MKKTKLFVIASLIIISGSATSLIFKGYDIRNTWFVFKPKKFHFQGYAFDLEDKFQLIQLYDGRSRIDYFLGFLPSFNHESNSDSIFLRDRLTNTTLYIS